MKSKKQWITTKEVCVMLDCTPMTAFNYRNGTGKKTKSPLPYYTKARGTQRHAIFFERGEVVRWAKKNGLAVKIIGEAAA